MAFAAGTGMLTFMDLVAAVASHNIKLVNKQESDLFGDKFKFILYLSFPSREDGLGLELCEGLEAYCKENNLTNFELNLRLSKGAAEGKRQPRWNEEFVAHTLRQYDGLKQVWVCGPPPISEMFERYLYEHAEDHKEQEIEIL